jgi:NADPH-dependent curcumin reductase
MAENELGLDGAIDYKSEDLDAKTKELCPKGVNVFFDNVGGETLDVMLANLALRGRIVLCGGISQYNNEEPAPGPKNYLNLIVMRGKMEGFLILDYAADFMPAAMELMQWVGQGKLKYQVDMQEGLEHAPETFQRIFTGKNKGKQLLKIAEAPLGDEPGA